MEYTKPDGRQVKASLMTMEHLAFGKSGSGRVYKEKVPREDQVGNCWWRLLRCLGCCYHGDRLLAMAVEKFLFFVGRQI